VTTRRGIVGAIVALAAGLIARPSRAAVSPKPGPRDPHIQTLDYDPDEVFLLRVALGYSLTLEFASDERIENVALGNSGVWQVMVNRRADHLFIKPMQGASDTNLSVVTDARSYNFELAPLAGPEPDMPFSVRFTYPVSIGDTPPTPARSRGRYRFDGSRLIRPLSMDDDGVATFISWRADAPIPAIFVINAEGKEALINGAVRDGRYVVDQVGERFVFRLGNQTAQAIRIRDRAPP
jgi:type IV secretion system protein VirB9